MLKGIKSNIAFSRKDKYLYTEDNRPFPHMSFFLSYTSCHTFYHTWLVIILLYAISQITLKELKTFVSSMDSLIQSVVRRAQKLSISLHQRCWYFMKTFTTFLATHITFVWFPSRISILISSDEWAIIWNLAILTECSSMKYLVNTQFKAQHKSFDTFITSGMSCPVQIIWRLVRREPWVKVFPIHGICEVVSRMNSLVNEFLLQRPGHTKYVYLILSSVIFPMKRNMWTPAKTLT